MPILDRIVDLIIARLIGCLPSSKFITAWSRGRSLRLGS
jgi:hypothetical protein